MKKTWLLVCHHWGIDWGFEISSTNEAQADLVRGSPSCSGRFVVRDQPPLTS